MLSLQPYTQAHVHAHVHTCTSTAYVPRTCAYSRMHTHKHTCKIISTSTSLQAHTHVTHTHKHREALLVIYSLFISPFPISYFVNHKYFSATGSSSNHNSESLCVQMYRSLAKRMFGGFYLLELPHVSD